MYIIAFVFEFQRDLEIEMGVVSWAEKLVKTYLQTLKIKFPTNFATFCPFTQNSFGSLITIFLVLLGFVGKAYLAWT